MRRLSFLAFMLMLLLPSVVFSQSKITLTGHVVDTTHAVIQKAQVVITPGNYVTTSNELGEFTLQGVEPGQYTITVTSAGFAPFSKVITVAVGQPAVVEAILSVSGNNVQVEVSAETGKDLIEAINQEITSANILNVMPEAQILSLPNANVADAIGRMPGVTVQRDEGEAVYVQVRGLDPRLSNTTVDGITIPAPEPGIRYVNLATIPGDMVASIELNKTLSANQDADGIGGSVNLVTKMASERPTFTLGTEIGETPIENTRYMGKVDTTLGQRFGTSKRLGLIFGASYDYNGRGINDIEPDPNINGDSTSPYDGINTPYYDKITLREYRYARLRYGGTVSADYKVNDHSTVSAHVIYSDFKDWGDKWYYELKQNHAPSFYESNRKPDLAIASLELNGSHVYNSIWVKWTAAVSRSRELNSGGNPEIDFDTSSALKDYDKANCVYTGTNPKSIYLPTWSPGCMLPNPVAENNTFDPTNYNLSTFITTSGQGVQLNLQDYISVGKNYHVGKDSATFEFGGMFRNAHTFQDAYTPTYDYCPDYPGYYPNDPGTSCQPSSPDPSSYADNFQSGFADPDYYSGNYHNGPFTKYSAINAYFKANPTAFVLDIPATRGGSDPNNFDLVERVEAGYVMNTINWKKFRLQAGLRLEATQVSADGNVVNLTAGPNGDGVDNNGNWIGTTSTSKSQSYVQVLPSVQGRWQFSPTGALRAVYARGLSRPNTLDLVPYLLDNGSGSVPRYSIGNPNEKPTTANNFDLLYEQQTNPLGLIQAGFFYKQLINPIVEVFVPYTSVNPDGSPDLAQQNQNAANANVYGFEISLRQRLSDEPGIMHAIILEGNYAYTVSNTNGIVGRTDSPSLIGTARVAYNIQPSSR